MKYKKVFSSTITTPNGLVVSVESYQSFGAKFNKLLENLEFVRRNINEIK